MLQLSNLTKAGKKRKRIGRGGSRGGTSGRGHKGQKARSGNHGVGLAFEGGQMPLVRRIPKRGFTNALFKIVYSLVNLEQLEEHFTEGQEITKEMLIAAGVFSDKKSKKSKNLVKILGNGTLTKKLIIDADSASQSAIKAVEALGGKIRLNKEI